MYILKHIIFFSSYCLPFLFFTAAFDFSSEVSFQNCNYNHTNKLKKTPNYLWCNFVFEHPPTLFYCHYCLHHINTRKIIFLLLYNVYTSFSIFFFILYIFFFFAEISSVNIFTTINNINYISTLDCFMLVMKICCDKIVVT